MAVPKRVKEGGIFFIGSKITVASAPGTYPIAVAPSTTSCAIMGLSITPDSSGLNDYVDVAHVRTTATTGGVVVKQIATNVYNMGGGITIGLDFGAMQLVDSGDSIRVSYVNSASIAMPVYITIEAIK